ncbi:MAG TPA: iron-containing alcohol dehydrogenase, partial [Spirochaetia bacterium]|nr:iron-containing alcohol dehydrogenase [Spirochaetia bacterium]
VICADTLVLKDAPHAMTAAGYGDLAAKLIAGSDWIISNAITGEPIDPVAWDLVQTGLRDCVSLSGRLNEGEAIEAIFSGLAMTGFAMQITKSSRPVSGAEHLFSHIWEMENLEKDGIPVYHGAKVALGTVASACFTEEVFKRSPGDIDIEKRLAHWPSWEERESEVRDAFSNIPQAVPQLIEINKAKYKTKEEIKNHYRTAVEIWEELKTRVQRQLIPSNELFSRFAEAECPTNPTEINLTSERFFQTFRRAQMLRNRFTVLDLAFELGILEECIEAVKASGRFAIENDSGKRTSSGPAIQRE